MSSFAVNAEAWLIVIVVESCRLKAPIPHQYVIYAKKNLKIGGVDFAEIKNHL
jgi:hypothetical protein